MKKSCARAGEKRSLNRDRDVAAGDPCTAQMERRHPAGNTRRNSKVHLVSIDGAGVENLAGRAVDDHFDRRVHHREGICGERLTWLWRGPRRTKARGK